MGTPHHTWRKHVHTHETISPRSHVNQPPIAQTQAKELMRALDIESVLCLADRTPLGRVEEVHFSAHIDTNTILFRSSGCCWLSCQGN